jgi:hypothetical protein
MARRNDLDNRILNLKNLYRKKKEAYMQELDCKPRPGDVIEYEDVFSLLFDKVLINEQCGSYSGDYVVFGIRCGRFGMVVAGYGSCSGCDALLAGTDSDDLIELFKSLYNESRMFGTWAGLREWIKKHDWEGDWVTDEVTDAINKGVIKLEIKYGDTKDHEKFNKTIKEGGLLIPHFY